MNNKQAEEEFGKEFVEHIKWVRKLFNAKKVKVIQNVQIFRNINKK